MIHFYVTVDSISYTKDLKYVDSSEKNEKYIDEGLEKAKTHAYLTFFYMFLYFFSILMYCVGIYSEVIDVNFKLKILGTTDKFPLKKAYKANEFLEIGVYLSNNKDHEEALKYFNKALELNPAYDKILIRKANELVHLRKYHEALECYDTVLKKNPENQVAKRNKILVNKKIYRMEKGEEFIKKEPHMDLQVRIRGLDLEFPIKEKTKKEKDREK